MVLFQVLLIPLLFVNFVVDARRSENQPAQYQYAFQNPDLPIDERVNNILSLMTIEEKLACLGTDPMKATHWPTSYSVITIPAVVWRKPGPSHSINCRR
jgi:hypothetical protein